VSDLSPVNSDSFADIPDPVAGGPSPLPRVTPAGAAPDRRTTRGRRGLAALGALGWLVAWPVLDGVRDDLGTLPLSYVVAELVVPLVSGLAALALALAPGALGLGLPALTVGLLAVMGPVAFWLVACGAPPPHAPAGDAASLHGMGACLGVGLACAAVPLGLAALAFDSAFAAAARARMMLVGAGLGLLAGAALNLHCPNVLPLHLAVHAVPVAVAALVGGALAVRARA
jgi:hypothetical protein